MGLCISKHLKEELAWATNKQLQGNSNISIPVRGQFTEACWVLNKISPDDIKIIPSGFGIRQ